MLAEQVSSIRQRYPDAFPDTIPETQQPKPLVIEPTQQKGEFLSLDQADWASRLVFMMSQNHVSTAGPKQKETQKVYTREQAMVMLMSSDEGPA